MKKARTLFLIGLAAAVLPATSLPAWAEPAPDQVPVVATEEAPDSGVTTFNHNDGRDGDGRDGRDGRDGDGRWDDDDDRWNDDNGRRGRWDRDRRCRYRSWCGPYADGFRDGYREGRREGDRGCRWDPERRRGSDRYRRGYIDGYRSGFRDGCRR